MVQRINPDAVVIDRNLPGMNGLIVVQGIRRWSPVPVIMLSSRAGPDDLVQAFQSGVDDYIKKPFLMDELILRLDACLKRAQSSYRAIIPEIYQSGDIRINYSTRQVWRKGVPVELTPLEYNLLVYMSQQGQQIMPYEQLLERVWEGPEKGTRQGLFVHVRRLREKIEADPEKPQIITNKWGVGYTFSP
jgi:DNA-binding response OmpR family regulator